MGKASIQLEKRSVTTSKNLFPVDDGGSGPIRSSAIVSHGRCAARGRIVSFVAVRTGLQQVKRWQLLAYLLILLLIPGQ